ncbi:craniofacial development protein 2-like [Achroia grisella]|uniref:craniofacial development protein 2-like n=1 Tax=Achroia grisella TaxID=688607 RepID=UPI0027D2FAF5|nr:craniofacial development protein 2-like [Achroia grisella]
MPWRSESGRGRSKAEPVVIMRNPCQISTWNVRTLLSPGKLEEVIEEMNRIEIDILGLCEVRWEGSGYYWKENNRIIYTGREKQGTNGTAIILNKKWGKLVENTIHYSDRITAVKIKADSTNLIIIQVYMPTSSYPDEEIEDMYNRIDEIIDTVNKNDNLIVMGDFKAVVGEEAVGNIVGKFGHGVKNYRGERLIQFCKENDMFIGNTFFKQPKRRLYTWKMPGDIGRYQIDFIIVKNSKRNQIISCKTLPGADVNTDHNLLTSTHNFLVKKNKEEKIDLSKLISLNLR